MANKRIYYFRFTRKSVRKYTVSRLMALQAVEIMRWAHIAHLHRFFFFETTAKTRSFVNRFWYTAATIKKLYTMLLLLLLQYIYMSALLLHWRDCCRLWYQCCPVITIYNIIILLFINNNNMSHTCTMHIQTHTHTRAHLYVITYYRRDKRCRRTRGVLVQCRPAAAWTPTHTQTHSRSVGIPRSPRTVW